jgi:xylose isomerase
MIKWIKSLIEDSVRKVVAEQVKDAIALATAHLDEMSVSMAEKVANYEIDYDDLANSLIANGLDYHQIANNIDLSDIAAEFDTSEIENKVAEQIDTDDVVQGVVDAIDTDDIAEKVKDEIEIDYSEIEINYAALGRALVEMART